MFSTVYLAVVNYVLINYKKYDVLDIVHQSLAIKR